MSNEEEGLEGRLDAALTLFERDLVRRTDWGAITFEQAERDLQRINNTVTSLKGLPTTDYLPEQEQAKIISTVTEVVGTLEKIDSFDIARPGSASPAQQRDQLVNEVHQRAEQLTTVAAQWIPYLAYQRGDVEENIARLAGAQEKAREILDQLQSEIVQRQEEIESAVRAAKEASGRAGAAVFTEDFDQEAKTLADDATKWLWATIVMAGLTLALSVVAFVVIESGLDAGEIIQRSTAKLAILAIFFTGTLWCGRLYKALRHQSAINRHRALSLQTFQAFSEAAHDDPTRDAVLLEATRAVFGPVPTGFLDGSTGALSTPQGMQILELARKTQAE